MFPTEPARPALRCVAAAAPGDNARARKTGSAAASTVADRAKGSRVPAGKSGPEPEPVRWGWVPGDVLSGRATPVAFAFLSRRGARVRGSGRPVGHVVPFSVVRENAADGLIFSPIQNIPVRSVGEPCAAHARSSIVCWLHWCWPRHFRHRRRRP